jgi:hypothetical protein
MTEVGASKPAPASERRDGQNADKSRGEPQAIQLLLPVWGTQFISKFLSVSLPTLLAPGNLPALAKSLPCKFIFLTSSDDAVDLRDHPAINYLRSICDVEIKLIDDLITGDNYSTTVTLAYTRAVRAAGGAMLDTCFFFMISDYIMADGSLANVLAKIRDGYDGVVAGNFQVVEESAQQSFFKRFDTGKPMIIVRPRNLMRWAINHLHPMTLANMVNFPLCHSVHSNRLFWRLDNKTLIGRFYLMHMICIRPETTNFVVGSSCDYSFIPEMCPSGRVHVMTDSDEYLVVEMQSNGHERNFVRLGPVNQITLTESLAEWATATHRKNAYSAVVFHAAKLPANLDSFVAESSSYVDAIESALPKPLPHRNHPYWLGAIAAHQWAVAKLRNTTSPPKVIEVLENKARGPNWWLFRLRNFVFGRPPQVRSWHPRSPDYRMLMNLVERHFSNPGSLLIISSAPALVANFLSGVTQSSVSLDLSRFLSLNREQFRPLIEKFDGCLLMLGDTHISRARDLIRRVKALLPADRTLLVFAANGYGAKLGPWFTSDMVHEVGQFFDHDMPIEEVAFVPAGLLPWIALRGMQNAFARVQKSWLWIPFESLSVGVLTIVSFVCNLSRRGSAEPPRNQSCSSVCLAMRKTMSRSTDIEIVEPSSLASRPTVSSELGALGGRGAHQTA